MNKASTEKKNSAGEEYLAEQFVTIFIKIADGDGALKAQMFSQLFRAVKCNREQMRRMKEATDVARSAALRHEGKERRAKELWKISGFLDKQISVKEE